MKKILSLTLAALMLLSALFCFASCKDGGSDLDYVKKNGKLVVGITEFAPMDYKNEKGEWIGFDADMATEFAKSLGVEVEFVVIDWNSKENELNAKSIDCVWNGMTLTDGVKKAMETTDPYCENAQVVVVAADKAAAYNTAEAVKSLNFAVEEDSAGENMAKENGYKYTSLTSQSDALMEVAAGTSDACIIDLLMAGAMIGEGTSYPTLTYTVRLNSEEYGVGFRKGSDLAAKLNEFFKTCAANGKLEEIATRYSVQDRIIVKK